ncbi:MAG: stage II sporulation protein P, partial [Clostridia bacterium]|nr:stage II sporulation protein P [Clostridia bacterium]
SYSEGDTASADENFRTDDTEKNMIAVGKRFADTLADNGINVIHCTEMFDLKSYPDAYNNSAAAVKSYMERYPGIQYVLDIHRDAVIRADGDVVKSDGGEGAQVMIVCGTDSMGADFPRWRENYVFGTEYQRIMREESPSLVRYMNLRNASFNQQLCNRYLLLEIGTCGNTLEEALSSAEFAANAFARLVRGE